MPGLSIQDLLEPQPSETQPQLQDDLRRLFPDAVTGGEEHRVKDFLEDLHFRDLIKRLIEPSLQEYHVDERCLVPLRPTSMIAGTLIYVAVPAFITRVLTNAAGAFVIPHHRSLLPGPQTEFPLPFPLLTSQADPNSHYHTPEVKAFADGKWAPRIKPKPKYEVDSDIFSGGTLVDAPAHVRWKLLTKPHSVEYARKEVMWKLTFQSTAESAPVFFHIYFDVRLAQLQQRLLEAEEHSRRFEPHARGAGPHPVVRDQ
ncbi:hypothetical protein JCM10213_007069 [Rhodosporidiobolus nylandii]